MKITVAIIVYDRFANIVEWARCWKMCYKEDCELIVIHNYKDDADKDKFSKFCKENNILYIARPNVGMDIGAFQDVCYNRLKGMPEWEYLLWCTDDVFPMNKSFIEEYRRQANKNTVVCLEISNEVKTHIRTTGFLIEKETAKKLIFPADPVSTREHCFFFEHRAKDAFFEQLVGFGVNVIQVNKDVKLSCMWDTHNRAHFGRELERLRGFKE